MPPRDAPPEGERPEPLRAKDALQHIASAWLLRRMEAFRRVRPFQVRVRLNVTQEPRTHVDPAEWRAGFLRVAEGHTPFELHQDLKEVAPQALLRDLFRPESEFQPAFERQPPRDVAGVEALRQARLARVRDAVPRIIPSSFFVEQVQVGRRRLLKEVWRPVVPDHLRSNREAAAKARHRFFAGNK